MNEEQLNTDSLWTYTPILFQRFILKSKYGFSIWSKWYKGGLQGLINNKGFLPNHTYIAKVVPLFSIVMYMFN